MCSGVMLMIVMVVIVGVGVLVLVVVGSFGVLKNGKVIS